MQEYALPEDDDDVDEPAEGISDEAAPLSPSQEARVLARVPQGRLGLNFLWHWPEERVLGQPVTCMAWNQVSVSAHSLPGVDP